MPAESDKNNKPMLMLCGHPGLQRTPDSRKYPVSLLKATAYKDNIQDLAKSGISEKACAAQVRRLATTREWV